MSQTNVPQWQVDCYHSALNNGVAAIGANLALVPDSSADRAAKLPATDSVPDGFAGIVFTSIGAGKIGKVATEAGEVAVLKASGAVTKGDRIYLDTATGKEGCGAKYTGFGTNGRKLILGTALTTAADGELFELRISVYVAAEGVQAGTNTLVAGTKTITGVALTANSRIFAFRKTHGGTLGTGGLEAPSASRDTGASTFVVNAVDTAGATSTGDSSTFDWLVIG